MNNTINANQIINEKELDHSLSVTDRENNSALDWLYKIVNINLTVNDNYDNFEVVLHRLLHALEVITNSEATSLLVFDTYKRDLIFSYATGNTAHDIIGLRVPRGEGIVHTVANTRKGMIVNDINSYGYYQKIDREIEYTTRNLMAFPLLNNDGEVYGIVEVCNKLEEKGGYTKLDFQLLSLFCQQAERNIRHSSFINSLRKNITTLTQKVLDIKIQPIIHESKEMKNIVLLMKKISTTDSPILITGEKGTGKTLFANHIHFRNYRRSKPLIELNCLEISKLYPHLKDLQLYLWGGEKNYKEGIKKDQLGVFEKAKEGTVILNDIEYLPEEIQNDLVQFLKHKFYYRVNSNKAHILDIRVICITTTDLKQLVAEQKFNEDLYFLINSLAIRLSSINKRSEDLSAAIKYYFDYFIKEFGKDIEEVEPQVITILKRYHWKYNMHSLILTIKSIILQCEDKIVTGDFVASYMFTTIEASRDTQVSDLIKNEVEVVLPLKDAVNNFKSQYIHKVLLQNNWNHTKTAKKLDIQRSYLSRLVKEYDLNKKSESK